MAQTAAASGAMAGRSDTESSTCSADGKRSRRQRRERSGNLGDRAGHEAVVGPGATAFGGHESGVAQETEVVADRRLREAGVRHEVADADLVGAGELVDDRKPRRIAERLEAV